MMKMQRFLGCIAVTMSMINPVNSAFAADEYYVQHPGGAYVLAILDLLCFFA